MSFGWAGAAGAVQDELTRMLAQRQMQQQQLVENLRADENQRIQQEYLRLQQEAATQRAEELERQRRAERAVADFDSLTARSLRAIPLAGETEAPDGQTRIDPVAAEGLLQRLVPAEYQRGVRDRLEGPYQADQRVVAQRRAIDALPPHFRPAAQASLETGLNISPEDLMSPEERAAMQAAEDKRALDFYEAQQNILAGLRPTEESAPDYNGLLRTVQTLVNQRLPASVDEESGVRDPEREKERQRLYEEMIRRLAPEFGVQDPNILLGSPPPDGVGDAQPTSNDISGQVFTPDQVRAMAESVNATYADVVESILTRGGRVSPEQNLIDLSRRAEAGSLRQMLGLGARPTPTRMGR